jgi:hypothetical protein
VKEDPYPPQTFLWYFPAVRARGLETFGCFPVPVQYQGRCWKWGSKRLRIYAFSKSGDDGTRHSIMLTVESNAVVRMHPDDAKAAQKDFEKTRVAMRRG